MSPWVLNSQPTLHRKMKSILSLILPALSIFSVAAFGQTAENFSLTVEEFQITGSPGVQSFAHATHNDKLLIIGGRTEGLHLRRPFEAFAASGNNTSASVIDVVNGQSWSVSLSSLPTAMYEQLQSTNMEFEQQDSMLYIIGGYGYSATAADHITYPKLTAVHVPGLINAIVNSDPISSFFRQINDARLKVTGGYLGRLGNRYYLAGGQNFQGRYNPMGPGHGPGFLQEYTNAIRSFEIIDNGVNLSISNYTQWTDTANLHRRDYNLVAQVFSDGQRGYTMFSGVFQYTSDIPWLNTVDIRDTGYRVRNNFNQYLNQYHTAHLPVYDQSHNAMHSIFFGGMSRYTLDLNGQLIDDPDVPFVNTISKVTRYANDSMSEFKIGEMPGLLGSGAEFIQVNDSRIFDEYNILHLDSLLPSKTLIGYVVGGIESSQPNIFFINDGSQSSATTRLFKVFITRNTIGVDELINGDLFFTTRLYPNPAKTQVTLEVICPHQSMLTIDLLDARGVLLKTLFVGKTVRAQINIDTSALADGNYIIRIYNKQYSKTLKLAKGD